MLLGIGAIAYEIYASATYNEFINKYTRKSEVRTWLQTHYLIFVAIHTIVSISTIVLSIYRLRLYKEKSVVKHIL